MTEETKAGASGSEVSWSGVERRRAASAPEEPAETFLPVPADWQSRGLAFLADLLIYTGLLFGARHFLGEILSGFLAMVYIVFRDVLFIFYPIYALTAAVIVVEALVSLRDPQRRRLGDRIGKTCVVQKEGVPVLA